MCKKWNIECSYMLYCWSKYLGRGGKLWFCPPAFIFPLGKFLAHFSLGNCPLFHSQPCVCPPPSGALDPTSLCDSLFYQRTAFLGPWASLGHSSRRFFQRSHRVGECPSLVLGEVSWSYGARGSLHWSQHRGRPGLGGERGTSNDSIWGNKSHTT